MPTSLTIRGELASEHVKLVKALMKSLNGDVQFTTSKAEASDMKKKPKVTDLDMTAKVYLTAEAEKARVGTAFQDRKSIYKKNQGLSLKELIDKELSYTSKGKKVKFGKKELMMDSELMKKKAFIRFEKAGEEAEEGSEGEEEEAEF